MGGATNALTAPGTHLDAIHHFDFDFVVVDAVTGPVPAALHALGSHAVSAELTELGELKLVFVFTPGGS